MKTDTVRALLQKEDEEFLSTQRAETAKTLGEFRNDNTIHCKRFVLLEPILRKMLARPVVALLDGLQAERDADDAAHIVSSHSCPAFNR